jgi:precorrin-3B synthase
MTLTARRGACPALFTPMQTGDGLLARITPADRIAPAAFIAFCEAARRHGNGTIEVTARGSLQVRGLTEDSAGQFASEVAVLDVAIDGVPVMTDPLPDDPAVLVHAPAIAELLRAAIARAELALAPKVSVIVDGGGRLTLDTLAADVRLRAIATREGSRLYVALAGDAATATALGSIPTDAAADVVVDLLGVIAARGVVRAGDVLKTDGIAEFAGVRHLRPDSVRPVPRTQADVIGLHALRDNSFARGIGLAFGHARADALAELTHAASARGARSLRPAPGRALLLIGISQSDALALAQQAERLGFIVHCDDPRRRIVACPGKPACGSGLIAARALAGEIACRTGFPGAGIALHVSGCRKGCAHPGSTPLTIVGTEHGCGVVRAGSARATPHHYVDAEEVVTEVSRLLQQMSEPAHV